MPEASDGQPPGPLGGTDAAQRPLYCGARQDDSPTAAGGGDGADRDAHQGMPTILGKAHAHYFSGRDGRRMLVVELTQGERLRLDAATDIVILDVGGQQVTVGVELPEDREAAGGGKNP